MILPFMTLAFVISTPPGGSHHSSGWMQSLAISGP